MIVAVHRRSGVRHLVADDDLATRCGRVLYRRSFRREEGDADCRTCIASVKDARAAALNRVDAFGGPTPTGSIPETKLGFREARP